MREEEEKRQKEIFLPRAVHEWVEIVFIVEREQLGYAKINKENGTLNIFLFRKISRSLREKRADSRVWRGRPFCAECILYSQ